MLNIAFNELMGRRPQKVLAQKTRLRMHQRHGVL